MCAKHEEHEQSFHGPGTNRRELIITFLLSHVEKELIIPLGPEVSFFFAVEISAMTVFYTA